MRNSDLNYTPLVLRRPKCEKTFPLKMNFVISTDFEGQ